MQTFLSPIALTIIISGLAISFALMPVGLVFPTQVHSAVIYVGHLLGMLNFILPVSELMQVMPWVVGYLMAKMFLRFFSWLVGQSTGAGDHF